MGKAKKPNFYVWTVPLNLSSGVLKPDNDCLQFVVNNPTAFVVKIGIGLTSTTSYEHIIKAQSIYISPVFHFNELKYTVDSLADGFIKPIFYAYNRWIGNCGSYGLT